MFTTNKIIPIDQVIPDNEEKIILTSSEHDLGEFPDFEDNSLREISIPPNIQALM